MRGALVAMILRKVMVLSTSARTRISLGKINNLLTADCEALEDFCSIAHVVWSSPVRIVICLYLLYNEIGWASFAGFACLFLTIPIQKVVVGKTVMYTRTSRKKTDERVKYVNEMLSSMNIIKMYAWEESVEKRIDKVRDDELDWIKKSALLSAVNFFFVVTAPVLVSVVGLGAYSAQSGHVLTAEKAFTAIALFAVLRFPLLLLPSAINSIATCHASVTRLKEFLLEEEIDAPREGRTAQQGEIAVAINGASFCWGASHSSTTAPTQKPNHEAGNPAFSAAKRNSGHVLNASRDDLAVPLLSDDVSAALDTDMDVTLKDIKLSVRRGELLAIIGATGAGKSSLLSALLGELPLQSNDERRFSDVISMHGSLAYVPQQAWIFNATVRENILFGKSFDQALYDEAISGACLATDLELLPSGDKTEIGEKGVNLSGGQKMRVSLARAIYANADIYLLDDPLAALDAHVAEQVFRVCINGLLKKRNATCLLVTNALSFLPNVDRIAVLNDRKFEAVDTWEKLYKANPTLTKLLQETEKKQHDEEERERRLSTTDMADEDNTEGNTHENGTSAETRARASSTAETPSPKTSAEEAASPLQKLMTDEEINKGTMGWSVVKAYLTSMGWFVFAGFMITSAVAQILVLAANYWVSVWTSDPPMITKSNGEPFSAGFYIAIYGAVNIAQLLGQLICRVVMAYAGIRASASLHRNMLSNLLRAPMLFYQRTPLGRILNRFTSDMGDVDRMMPPMFSLFVFSVMSSLATLGGIAIGTPYALVAFVPVFVFFIWLQRYFQCSSRELKRLDSVNKSPVYSHFDAMLGGIPSIRAYGAQERLVVEGCAKIDHSIRVDWCNNSCVRWLTLRLEFLGGLMTLATSLFVVVLADSLTPSVAGLALSYSLSITQLLTLGVRVGSQFENAFNAIERILHYTTETPQEKPAFIAATEPSAAWPQAGIIAFKNVSMRYRGGLPLVLDGVSFTLTKAAKVGVVGRTGAGKSSMFLTLFRIVELAGGEITIDDVNISKIGLHTLRSRLSIIPQEPVLFTGTVRFNLDPFNEHTDEQLWAALKRAYLAEVVERGQGDTAAGDKDTSKAPIDAAEKGSGRGLDMMVEENGANFSVGQRQLLCLARTLLRKSRVIVLDEATAAVDPHTDACIQRAIREEFKDFTMLTIAHRINTIIDNDVILVLDKGKLAEVGSPHKLLSNKKSLFSMLVDALGETEAEGLRKMAHEASKKKTAA